MEIRILGPQELLPALDLVREVFDQDVAAFYTEEGIQKFQEFIQYEIINQKYQNRELFFFGAFEEMQLTGVLAINRTGHICLFFVKKDWQGKGIGRMLYQRAYQFCMWELKVNRMTVNVPPKVADQFQYMGLQVVAQEQTLGGMVFVPMEVQMIQSAGYPARDSSKTTAVIIAVAAGIGIFLVMAILTVLFGLGIYYVSENLTNDYYEEFPYEEFPYEDDLYGTWPEDGSEMENETDDDSGIGQIDAYKANHLPYEIEQEEYDYLDTEKTNTYIEFHVLYPELTGKGKEFKEINQKIKECAMATVDEIYTNPSEEIREKVLEAQSPALVSSVEYKICYASEDFISIAFQDYYAKGDADSYGGDLRTINIGLNDGKIYEVKDIVRLNDSFMEQWLSEMRDEADNEGFLAELDLQELKQVLEGDTQKGVYKHNFFVCEDGIEIGLAFDYPEGDLHDLGYMWVTAPFSFEEIQKYATESGFWKCFN